MAGEANVNAVVTVRLASVGDADTIGLQGAAVSELRYRRRL
jgi:hypothetical protein